MSYITKNLKLQKGVTLVELLVVIFIISLLIGILTPRLSSFTKKSQVGVVETDIRLMKSNIQEHFVDHPTQPLTVSLLQKYLGTDVQQISTSGADPAIYKLPSKKDPWGTPYYLEVGTSELFVEFHSYGPDGVNNIQSGLNSANLGDDIVALFYPQP